MQQTFIIIGKQASMVFPCLTPMHASSFRKTFARWVCASPVSQASVPELPLVFQRHSDGLLVNAQASFRFEAQSNAQVLHALGESACATLARIHDLCNQLQSSRPKFLGQASLLHTDIALDKSQRGQYQSSKLIVCKNAEQYEHWSQCDDAGKVERIKHVVLTGIERQLQSFACSTPLHIEISDVQLLAEWPEPKLQSIRSKAYVRCVFARYRLNVKLIGSWAAGPLISKGYGLITAS